MNREDCNAIPPFAHLPFDLSQGSIMRSRLRCAMESLGGRIDHLMDRLSIRINRDWVKEAIPDFVNGKENALAIRIWPGNTKGQGWPLYSMPMNWLNNTQVTVNGKVYRIEIERHIKFMHFNRYITSFEINIAESKKRLKKEINTLENQHKLAGKWNRDRWGELAEILDAHVNFDWKEECDWEANFEHTDRGYLTLSLGFCVTLYVPYNEVKVIDAQPSTYGVLGVFLLQCSDALVNMVEGNTKTAGAVLLPDDESPMAWYRITEQTRFVLNNALANYAGRLMAEREKPHPDDRVLEQLQDEIGKITRIMRDSENFQSIEMMKKLTQEYRTIDEP